MYLSPVAMHLPDGFLSILVSLICWTLSVPVIALALRRVGRDLGERQVPLMGVLAAAIFAGQMLNFSVAGGTSGHLLGAALATILLGPWAAILVMTCVVGLQALVFQDGGLLAMGANLLNMAVIGVAVAHTLYRLVQRVARGAAWGVFAGGVAAAWASIFIASLAAALQLAASGTSPANVAVPAMGGIHALIGVGEGLITLGALAFLYSARRDLFAPHPTQAQGGMAIWIGGLVITLALVVASPLASAHPDGLEWVAGQNGFLNQAQGPVYQLLPDYLVPGISNEASATILAGLLGTILVLGVAYFVGRTRTTTQAGD